MGDPNEFTVASTGAHGSQDHALVSLTNKKAPHKQCTDAFFASYENEGAVWIAEEICEECDAWLNFDGDRVLSLLRDASTKVRLKTLELLKARANEDHKTYLLATDAMFQKKAPEGLTEFRSLLDQAKAKRSERDRALGRAYDVYHYTAIAPFSLKPFHWTSFSHAALAAVDRETGEGKLLSWQGHYPSDSGFSLAGRDPFIKAYLQVDRPVWRYKLELPQDEAPLVLAAIEWLIADWEKAGSALEKLTYSHVLGRMCGDQVADALEASWSYCFQAFREDVDSKSQNMGRRSYFGPRLLDLAPDFGRKVPGFLLELVGEHVAELPDYEHHVFGITNNLPFFVRERYEQYFLETGGKAKLDGGLGFVTEEHYDFNL